MEQMLRDSVDAYFSLARRVLLEARGSPARPEITLVPKPSELLLKAVHKLERTSEFDRLVKCTTLKFGPSESTETGLLIAENVKAFCRISGFYLDNFYGNASPSPDLAFERFVSAFESDHEVVTHLAPLERIEFELQGFGTAEFIIKKLSRDEHRALLKSESCKIFKPDAFINTEDFEKFWWLIVYEHVSAREAGTPTFDPFDGSQLGAAYEKGRFSNFPRMIELCISALALYPWPMKEVLEEQLRRVKAINERLRKTDASHKNTRPHRAMVGEEMVRRPRIPFAISVSDSLIHFPPVSPINLSLELVPGKFAKDSHDEWISTERVPLPGLHLSEEDCHEFEDLATRLREFLSASAGFTDSWDFLQTALDFRTRAFLAYGTDELLWNITAIEAVLGEKGPGLTDKLATRLAKVLTPSRPKTESIKKRFKQFYDRRSDLVHGKCGPLHARELQADITDSGEYANGVVRWAISICGILLNSFDWSTGAPTSADVLYLLDLDASRRPLLLGLIESLKASSEDLLT